MSVTAPFLYARYVREREQPETSDTNVLAQKVSAALLASEKILQLDGILQNTERGYVMAFGECQQGTSKADIWLLARNAGKPSNITVAENAFSVTVT